MLAQIHRNKRSAALASVLFLALLVYTWHSLNLESLLPAPLLHGGHKQVPVVAARMHEVTCPGPIGEQLPSKRIPLVRGRNVSSTTHGETLSVPKVVVLIFYGRRNTVSILDCYLKVRTEYPMSSRQKLTLYCSATLSPTAVSLTKSSGCDVPNRNTTSNFSKSSSTPKADTLSEMLTAQTPMALPALTRTWTMTRFTSRLTTMW